MQLCIGLAKFIGLKILPNTNIGNFGATLIQMVLEIETSYKYVGLMPN